MTAGRSPPRTHAEALARRRPEVAPSDCPGPLRPRRHRRTDAARVCTLCGATLLFHRGWLVSLDALAPAVPPSGPAGPAPSVPPG